jgi:DNA replication protein DnaC
MMAELQDQAIRQHCKALRMPTMGTQFARLAEAATREGQSHLGYLEALLTAEMEERESRAVTRLLHEARLPRMKTLEGFEFDRSGVSAPQLRTLAEGDYVSKAEPVLLIGEAGTGKTHVSIAMPDPRPRGRRVEHRYGDQTK